MADYESDRLFRVSSFAPSHRQLIIRSDPEPGHDTRVEIYFGNVDYMALRPIFQGLHVRVATAEEVEALTGRHGPELEPQYCFVVDTGPPLSYVLSGQPSWREAPMAFDDPSLFDFSKPWPSVPDAQWGFVG